MIQAGLIYHKGRENTLGSTPKTFDPKIFLCHAKTFKIDMENIRTIGATQEKHFELVSLFFLDFLM
jgi:hypothetical protein